MGKSEMVECVSWKGPGELTKTLIRKAQVENDQMFSHHEGHEDHEGKTEHMGIPSS